MNKNALAISLTVHIALICMIATSQLIRRFPLPKGDPAGYVEVIVGSGPGMPNASSNVAVKTSDMSSTPAADDASSQSLPNDKSKARNTTGGSQNIIGSSAGSDNPNETLTKIIRKIVTAKYYPRVARHKGMEGNPRVRFAINADGTLEFVELVKRSQYAELNEAALETIRRSAPLPYYSSPIELTVRYSLNR